MKKENIIKNIIFITVLVTTTFLLAGCAGNGATVTQTPETQAVESAATAGNEVIIEGNAFKPDSLTVKVGDTVTWVNNDSYNHTVTAKTGEFDSGTFGNGATFSFTFDKEGTYDYICTLHTFMTGKIIVTI